ncbi:MAG: lipoprotein-releasing ABC transporter permease subunit [Moraxellaceae bacterium]|jgi:lipoprotein-releasing system permease protein|nr:lipoprotein-releasing ABC transporter permease subunit [Moraxellaceae bacterium]MBK7300560.1 lipoprotein-releasing ABC transporter permease subunit [Moraxellaceae bacterium]MBK9185214.1 lipoprotein-releasing ABC transporter permease subunit [Moraxellaceae bacterium]HQV80777.1 lipoprotein-releasing ABC transporter permease subunit [Agitococcus sp.]
MFKPVSLLIGLRYTRAKRRNHFISFISLTSIIGLMLGVAVLITVLSVMNGFDRELKNRILGMIPHATINSREPFHDWQKLAEFAKKNPQVMAVAPYTQLQGMLAANGQVTGAMISGVEPQYEKKVSIVEKHMQTGSLDNLQADDFGIVLGETLALNLGLQVGDKMTLVLPEAAVSPAGVIPRFKRFTVVGIFKVGADVDGLLAYIHISDAGKMLRIGDQVQGVRLQLHDIFESRPVLMNLLSKLPDYFYGNDWTQTHGNLFSAIQMEKAMMGLLLLLIVAVAAFNIVSSLVMVVTDKKADIAILRTLGASPQTITRIFMVQGAVIGLFGTLGGVLLGVIIALNISDFMTWVEHITGQSFFDAYFVNYLPSELKWSDVIGVSFISALLSFLATIYPARKAAQVQPAEALRYE